MKKILLYIAAAFLSLIMLTFVAAFLIISFLDLNNYRDTITAKLSEALGQEVKIYGVFDAQLSFSPSVEITDIEIGDTNNPVIKIQNFYTKVSLLSLLGRPVIEELTLHDAIIRLEKKDGISNLGSNKNENKADNNGGGGNFLSNLPVVKMADIKNVTITSADLDANTSFEIPIQVISISGHSNHADINVDVGDMKSNGKSLGGLVLEAHANPESVIVESIKQGKTIAGNLEYYPDSKISTDIAIKGFSMEVIDILTGGKYGLSGNIDGNIKLNATGKSKKTLMQSLQGQVNLQSDKITIRKGIPYLDVVNLVNLGVQTSGCVVMNIPIEGGIANLNGASALSIGDIITFGQVNLGTERLNITNNVSITLPVFTAKGDVKITGHFDNPKVDASNFGDLTVDGQGIIKNIAEKPEDVVKEIGSALGGLLGQSDSKDDTKAAEKATNLQACNDLLKG